MKVGDNVRITGPASFASNLDEHIGQIGVIVMHDPSDMSADSRYRVKLPTDGPFWFPETSVEPATVETQHEPDELVTRDLIALAAMRGLLSRGNYSPAALAARSYEYADAMIAARNGGSK